MTHKMERVKAEKRWTLKHSVSSNAIGRKLHLRHQNQHYKKYENNSWCNSALVEDCKEVGWKCLDGYNPDQKT